MKTAKGTALKLQTYSQYSPHNVTFTFNVKTSLNYPNTHFSRHKMAATVGNSFTHTHTLLI